MKGQFSGHKIKGENTEDRINQETYNQDFVFHSAIQSVMLKGNVNVTGVQMVHIMIIHNHYLLIRTNVLISEMISVSSVVK